MTNVYRIFKKETAGYFNSASAYIILVFFLLVGSFLFFYLGRFFAEKGASMVGFFQFIPWLMLFFAPALAMRVWAEEKRSGTQELLMTMPLRDWEVVLGKYFAALLLLVLALALTFPLPLLVRHFALIPSGGTNPVDLGQIACGYLASLLFGATVLALGCFVSSLTDNQIIAFIITFAIGMALTLIGFQIISEPLGVVGEYLASASLWTHFIDMYRGVIASPNVVYYLSLTLLFLFLNVRSVESRKWR